MVRICLLLITLHLPVCLSAQPAGIRIAILPFTNGSDSNFRRSLSAETLHKMYRRGVDKETINGTEGQISLYKKLARQISRGKLNFALQSFTQTNQLLALNGLDNISICEKSRAELCVILGVDFVLQVHTFVESPYSRKVFRRHDTHSIHTEWIYGAKLRKSMSGAVLFFKEQQEGLRTISAV